MANRLMTEEGCSDKEIAKELSLLTMYDLVMLIDDSASMFDEEDGKRRETLKRVLENICRIYKLARPEGIVSVKFLNCPQGRKNVKNADFLDNHPWNGVTRIGTELKKILDTFVFLKKMTKPLLIMVITDGGVEGERKDTLTGVISKCVTALERKKKGKHAVSFHFSKVGNDRAAEKFLRDLDNHSKVGEYVDCLQSRRLEEIDDKDMKWVLLPKLLLGAISEKWDDRDDKPGVGTDTGGNTNSKPELEDIED
ncbi:hypothetical protein K440DRAFT_602803 [Wilcoxina mikolae CBS 423.85]|nr:hypothetical protein K440DRAFT_602803 [Wilcoxina mikolae CBS 423.85]